MNGKMAMTCIDAAALINNAGKWQDFFMAGYNAGFEQKCKHYWKAKIEFNERQKK